MTEKQKAFVKSEMKIKPSPRRIYELENGEVGIVYPDGDTVFLDENGMVTDCLVELYRMPEYLAYNRTKIIETYTPAEFERRLWQEKHTQFSLLEGVQL